MNSYCSSFELTCSGASLFRSHFADWAAHNTAEMDYLTRAQYERGLLEITLAGDWDYYRPSVWSGDSEGTGGQWVRPPSDLTARGWAYNVFNVTNTEAATYKYIFFDNMKLHLS